MRQAVRKVRESIRQGKDFSKRENAKFAVVDRQLYDTGKVNGYMEISSPIRDTVDTIASAVVVVGIIVVGRHS